MRRVDGQKYRRRRVLGQQSAITGLLDGPPSHMLSQRLVCMLAAATQRHQEGTHYSPCRNDGDVGASDAVDEDAMGSSPRHAPCVVHVRACIPPSKRFHHDVHMSSVVPTHAVDSRVEIP